jgi:hypothetical protein
VGLPAGARDSGRRSDVGLSRPGIATGGRVCGPGGAPGTGSMGWPRTRRPATCASGRSGRPGVGRPVCSASGLGRACTGGRATVSGRRAEGARLDSSRWSSGLGRRAGRVRSCRSATEYRRLGRTRRTRGATTPDGGSFMGSAGGQPGRLSAARVRMGTALGRARVGRAQDRRARRTRGAFVGRVLRSGG